MSFLLCCTRKVIKISSTPDQISTKIIATLAATLPGLSCEIGTPERKIIDACAEAISEAYIDQYLLGSLLDIDTKGGLELEQFVGIFGYGRFNGKAATGVVRVTAITASIGDVTFPLGTQFYTKVGLAGANTTLYFASTQTIVLVAGTLTCDIPVQCTTVGSAGNLAPDSIAYLGNQIGGSTTTNLSAMTGGVDIETDQSLRQRFKDTLLRNVSGTADFYEALCQQNNNVSRVVVFGPVNMYLTQIVVPDTELILTLNQDVKYAWEGMASIFTNLGQEDEIFYSPVDDYDYVGGVSPTITRAPAGALVVNDVVDLEIPYTTRCSRNDPLAGITNKVDIFVDGVDPFTVTESSVISSTVLTGSSASPFFTGNFERIGDPGTPLVGNRFMRLGSVPIVSFPSSLTVDGVTYFQGTGYFLLQGTTLVQGSQREVSGIEWDVSGPSTGVELTVQYVYNRVPELLNTVMAAAKQITTDVMVHQARFAYIRPCLTIEYDRSYSVSVVNSAIVNRLQAYFAQLPFGAQVKLSNLCMAVQQTLGVVDTKITTTDVDPTDYGVQVFDNSTDTVPTLVETTDFKLDDNRLAIYQGVLVTRIATP